MNATLPTDDIVEIGGQQLIQGGVMGNQYEFFYYVGTRLFGPIMMGIAQQTDFVRIHSIEKKSVKLFVFNTNGIVRLNRLERI